MIEMTQRFKIINLLLVAFIAPLLAEVQQAEDPKCPYTTYLVGLNENNQFHELFRSCYDPTNVSAKYTIHTLRPPFNAISGNSTKSTTWTTNRVISTKAAESFSNSNIRSHTTDNFPQYHRGHLTPSADFSLPLQRQATYTYVNAVPQLSSLNGGKWKSLEYFVRSLAEGDNRRIVVTTGGLGVLALNDRPIYLYQTRGNPIPEFVYKFVHRSGHLQAAEMFAFVAYNHLGVPTDRQVNGVCEIYCCNATQFVHKNMPTFVEFFNITRSDVKKDSDARPSIWKNFLGSISDIFSSTQKPKTAS